MTHTTKHEDLVLERPSRQAALRRNLWTTVIIAIAFSGGPFGLTWLATTSATSFLVLTLLRVKQQQPIS